MDLAVNRDRVLLILLCLIGAKAKWEVGNTRFGSRVGHKPLKEAVSESFSISAYCNCNVHTIQRLLFLGLPRPHIFEDCSCSLHYLYNDVTHTHNNESA